ncbi:MAG: hypothetical protein QME96_13670 [Myxococcota bacterium]|nr:hypothetical protein [Myxococcota bacterium]
MNGCAFGWAVCGAVACWSCYTSGPGSGHDGPRDDAVDDVHAGEDAATDDALGESPEDGPPGDGEGGADVPDAPEDAADADDGGDAPCPPADRCGPGEYWEPAVEACRRNCRNPCANPCPDVCGCGAMVGDCGSPRGCDCFDDWDCWMQLRDDTPCDGGYECLRGWGCERYGPVTCPEGQACLPETGLCSCATHNDCRFLDRDDDFCNSVSPRCTERGCDRRWERVRDLVVCPAGLICEQATGECVPE